MDFIGRLPKPKGKDTIFVVVDRFTKYVHFFALSHPYSALEVAQLFVKAVVRLHGFPLIHCQTETRFSLANFPTWLPWAEFWFNTKYSASSQMTSFKALYGCDLPLILKGTTIPSNVEGVNQMQEERDAILKELEDNLCKATSQQT
ncbi:hypothetical protein V8G54_001398 [Vigna mungo]|uniref:Integrase catalytic domain-containing protein n=1 Tax=Vigna mungo TaxID=3915 RepID=A0AAQ3S869_VIGMU